MPRDFNRRTLRPRHRPLVRALAEAMFACDRGPSPDRLDRFVDEVDDFVSHASKTLRVGLVLMLQVVRFAPLLVLWRFATFESLPRSDRTAVLERMERSRLVALTLVFAAYKTILSLIYFEHPDELRDMGYRPQRRRHLHALPTYAEAAE